MAASFSACNVTTATSTSESVNSTPPTSSAPTVNLDREFKNIIVVIGDGMGENHILNCIDYFGLGVPVFIEDQEGYIQTRSANNLVTDSAAGGTALATGKKVNNGNIAIFDSQRLTQITTLAREQGMKTGIVTTDVLSGATPAAFSAFSITRNATNAIINTQARSEINLLLGQSDSSYLSRQTLFEEQGYTFASSEETLLAEKDSDKLIGVMPYVGSEYISGNEEDFQLKEMAQFAVEYLDNDNGFFLMIEGAYIDKHSHNNYFSSAMSEMRSLIDTIEYLYEFAEDGETAIFITADHETGGLQRETNPRYMGNNLYTTGSHTATDVPLYVHNYEFDVTNFDYNEGDTPQNTVVFEACKSILFD